jgi:probable HAF family extracellular repeat protein
MTPSRAIGLGHPNAIRAALATILCSAATSPWALPSRYHLQDLGPESNGRFISASAQVTGIDARFNMLQPALWTDGVVKDLDDPFEDGSSNGVNASGVVVGDLLGQGIRHAVVWASDGTLTDLGAIAGMDDSEAPAINDSGDCLINDGTTGRALLSPGCTGTGLIDIGSLGKGITGAAAINASGQIAGVSLSKTGQHAFLYTAGHMKDLGVLPGCVSSFANALNASGHVVGRSEDAREKWFGYFWNGRKMKPVGTLGGKHSIAYGINDADVVVGNAQYRTGFWSPFVLDEGSANPVMVDLRTLLDSSADGWTILDAFAINASGQILVDGTAPGDENRRSAILTPVQ